MILGNSKDTHLYEVYRNRHEPFNYIEIDVLNKESMFDIIEEYEEHTYEKIENRLTNYVDDGWHEGIDFISENINLLVECDFCEELFEISYNDRRVKASLYLKYFNTEKLSTGRVFNEEMLDLYKDNCERCMNSKKRESYMINNGYWHPSQCEINKEKVRNSLKYADGIKTSRGQRYIAKLMGANLNILVGYYFADMVLEDNIIIEYDGGGHNLNVLMGQKTQEQFDEDESRRNSYMFSKGYKILRVISKSELFPIDEKYFKELLCESIAQLILSEESQLTITFNTRVDDEVHGRLKPVKAILENSEWGEDIL